MRIQLNQARPVVVLAGLCVGILWMSSGDAQSQISVTKENVALQAANPGFSQSGNSNISGTARAGQFVGSGAGLSNLSAAAIASGTLSDARLSASVAMRNVANTFSGVNTFTNVNTFSNFVGVRRTSGAITGADSFGIGESATGFDGMYVKTSASGKPFYGYSTGTLTYHYLDGADGAWKLYHGGGIRLHLTSDGKLGIGANPPTYMLDVNGVASVAGFRMPAGAAAKRILQSDGTGLANWADPAWTEVDGPGSYSGLELASNRKVGIGVGQAWGQLDVAGDVAHPLAIFQNNYSQQYPYMKAGVLATAGGNAAVHGVYARGNGQGTSNSSYGVSGFASGQGPNYGLYGAAFDGTINYGVYGQASSGTNYAGYFNGALYATSSSAGVKSFLIDHPLDPENMYLEHSSIESNERMNLYRGQTTTDSKGFATITVPNWFSALNENIQAQLTVVDDSDDFVLAKVVRQNPDGSFRIRTSKGNVQVNWMLSGVRKDPTSLKYPMEVERMKNERERGKYLIPEAYGQPKEQGIHYVPADVPTSNQR